MLNNQAPMKNAANVKPIFTTVSVYPWLLTQSQRTKSEKLISVSIIFFSFCGICQTVNFGSGSQAIGCAVSPFILHPLKP